MEGCSCLVDGINSPDKCSMSAPASGRGAWEISVELKPRPLAVFTVGPILSLAVLG